MNRYLYISNYCDDRPADVVAHIHYRGNFDWDWKKSCGGWSKGTKIWLNNKNVPHKIDGPAVITASGRKMWYVNGILKKSIKGKNEPLEHLKVDEYWT